MNQSSAIQITTTMDTTNVAATTTETVANDNANAIRQAIVKINAFSRIITMKDGDKEKKVERTFIAINDEPATAIENVSFGSATSLIRTAEKLYGVDAVDVCICHALNCDAKFILEDEYVTNIVIDDVNASAVKDALLFYKELNA